MPPANDWVRNKIIEKGDRRISHDSPPFLLSPYMLAISKPPRQIRYEKRMPQRVSDPTASQTKSNRPFGLI